MSRIDKPALLRQLFQLGCLCSGQIVAFQKLAGQLQDVGNTTTIAHYLELLGSAGMLCGLQKFSGRHLQQRLSSPKLLVLNTALMSAQPKLTLDKAKQDPERWGRIVESAVGAHLVNASAGTGIQVFYWREGMEEVDFVLTQGKSVTAIEVKSGRRRDNPSGIELFVERFRPKRTLLVGVGGISLDEFLRSHPSAWL